MAICRLRLEETVLLVIDIQEKLLPHIAEHESLIERCDVLIRACRELEVPILVTEQYPQGLGPTVGAIKGLFEPDQQTHSKLKFSSYIEPIRKTLADLGRRTVILCGIETHVCVLQTAMDLADSGFQVVLAADAVSSRRDSDKQLGINRMRDFGVAQASVEMAIFELVHEAGTERFKKIRPIVR